MTSRIVALPAALWLLTSQMAFAGLADDMALCRKSWWGVAQTAACGRVIAAPDADDLARAEAYAERARGLPIRAASAQAFADIAESIKRAPWNPEAFRLRAVLHQQNGDAAGAIADYDAAIAIAPHNDYFASRARLHMQLGDGAKAIADFTTALATARSKSRLLNERGLAYLKQADAAAAVADFDTMLQEAGGDDLTKQQALAGRAKGFLGLGETKRAIADATAVLALNPKAVGAALTRAEAYLKTGENILALADANTAAAPKSGTVDAFRLRAEARLKTGDVAGAQNDIAIARIMAPENSEIAALAKTIAGQVTALGLPPAYGNAEEAYATCLDSRNNGERIPACTQVTADTTFADARKGYPHNILGHFHYERRLYDLAVASFKAAIATGQHSAPNYSMLGLTYSNLKRNREAIAAYQEGLKYEPNDGGLLSGLANTLEKSGDCTAALAAFGAATRVKPDRNNFSGIARCNESLGNYEAAAAAYGEALKLEEKPTGKKFVYELQAEAYMAAGQAGLALQSLWAALKIDPGDKTSTFAVAEALLMKGSAKDAAALLTQAIAAEPKASHLVALRALAHLQAGDLAAALADADAAANSPFQQAAWFLVRARVRLAMRDHGAALGDVEAALATNPFSFEARALKAEIGTAQAAE